MAKIETITMSMREVDRLQIIQAVADRNLKPWRAAERLGLTSRQVHRLVNRYRLEGPAGLISRKRAKRSNRQLPPEIASKVLALIREHYIDFGPTLACEKLAECHGLSLAKETVRRMMTQAGFWIPRKLRPPKVYQPRNRRACFGELIQIDGSDHRWFDDRAPACTLLVYVDDATGKLMQLLFTAAESTFSYFQATRAYLEKHGKPVAFYSDKASVFHVSKKHATGGTGHTQFARALYELSIEGLCANSSQAKGRVERAHLTLQDRLVKELRLRKISSVETANAFAAHFMADYNQRFGKPPRSDHNAHRALRTDEDLDLIFTVREPRRVSNSLTLQYDKQLYMLPDLPAMRRLMGKYIDVYDYPDGRIEIRAAGELLPYSVYDRLTNVDQGAIVENKRLGHVLQITQILQEQRDNRRSMAVPSRAHLGHGPIQRKAIAGKKSPRQLSSADLSQAIKAFKKKAISSDNKRR